MPDQFSQDEINRATIDYLKNSDSSSKPKVDHGSAFSDLLPYVAGSAAGGLLAKGAAVSKPLLGMLTALPKKLLGTNKLTSSYPMTVYHASPHKFDKFDLSKVGTGQGAQSYGHGIYTAENPLVSGRGGEYDKEFTGKYLGHYVHGTDHGLILDMLKHGYTEPEIRSHLINKGYSPEWAQHNIDLTNEAKSHIYEVGINAHPDQFLRWDQPFRSNSSDIRDKINAAKQGWTRSSWGGINDIEGGMVEPGLSEPGMVRSDIYGDQLYHSLGSHPEQSTERLLNAGIPGIRYLDQGSRDKNIFPVRSGGSWSLRNDGTNEWASSHDYDNFFDAQKDAETLEAAAKPTYNYVMFDDKLMNILKRYGIAAPAALPALGSVGAGNQDIQ